MAANSGSFRLGHSGNPKAQVPYRINGYADISPTQWAYLAGLIDGEGSFYVCFDKRNDVYSLEMSIANTSRTLIEWLLLHFGGTEKLSGVARRDGCPVQWAWIVRGRKAAPIIAGVLPYLIIKTRQAKLAEEFLATYDMPPDRTVRNVERQRLKAAITALNCLKGKER